MHSTQMTELAKDSNCFVSWERKNVRNTSTPDVIICIGVVDAVPPTVLKHSESNVVDQHQMRLLTTTTWQQ